MSTDLKNLRIMLVDDDSFLLEMYALKFKERGIQIETYSNPSEALEVLRGGAIPDVLMMDVVMPELDGIELLQLLKEEKLGNPTIIMLSNQGQDTDVEKAVALGADGYIVKANVVPSEVIQQTLAIYQKQPNAV